MSPGARPRRSRVRVSRVLAVVVAGLLGGAAEASAHVSGSAAAAPGLIYLIVVGATIVLSLIAGAYFIGQTLTEKPWLPVPGKVVHLHDGRASSLPSATLGLRVFLAVVAVVFSLLVAAYAERMAFPDWRPLPEPWLLWPNTAVLILSSIALQWARVSARRGQDEGAKLGLLAGGVFAFAFLAGQLLAWQQLRATGYFAAANPANSFFYLITALHGLHLLGGLVAWGLTTAKLWRGVEVFRVQASVELCAVYWHFLLVVWVVLFGLLLIT
ncbi:MAG: cytochrome c oxidase subunit 3 [Proteobacteria bacterium]|nr:cytochrome c oxidase subunit 3 [Pseudomonadota bacterium]